MPLWLQATLAAPSSAQGTTDMGRSLDMPGRRDLTESQPQSIKERKKKEEEERTYCKEEEEKEGTIMGEDLSFEVFPCSFGF